MSGTLINVRSHCRACKAPLTLEEMHYLNQGDGTATCSKCEEEWAREIRAWAESSSKDETPAPKRP